MLNCYIIGSTLLALAYIFLIRRYKKGWDSIPEWTPSPAFEPHVKVSVIIPARNEATHILKTLKSLSQQQYPKHLLEVIVVDDHSEDETAMLVNNVRWPNVHLIRLTEYVQGIDIQSYKKKAIEVAIAQSQGELIITTDADCVFEPDWIRTIVSLYQHQDYHVITAPVNFYNEKNALQRFQSLDFLGMMAITAAGVAYKQGYLANGANLTYTKRIFERLSGFEGIDQKASGDDIMLVHKVAKEHSLDSIAFLKSRAAIVRTEAKATWSEFYQQRLRWATKNASAEDWRNTLQLAIVFLFCWILVIDLALIFVWKWAALLFVGHLACKWLSDYFFLKKMANWFGRMELMKGYWRSQLYHTGYILVIGTMANLVKQYEWKGRKVE